MDFIPQISIGLVQKNNNDTKSIKSLKRILKSSYKTIEIEAIHVLVCIDNVLHLTVIALQS